MLQSSGPISLRDIGIEFEDTAPHNLNEFYGKGGVVESGILKLSDFYGKSNYLWDLVYPNKMAYVYTTKTVTIKSEYIIAGITDIINGTNSYTITEVSNPKCGIVVFDGTNIRFTSKDIAGKPASFDVIIAEQRGNLETITVSVIVLPPYVPGPPSPNGDIMTDILGINEKIDDVIDNTWMSDILSLNKSGVTVT